MRTTTRILAALFASLLLFGTVACSSDSKDETSTEGASQDDGGSNADDSSSSADDSSSSADDSSSSDDGSSSSDDMSDLPLNMGDCLSVSMAYASIYLSALGGEEAMQEAVGELDQIKGQVPDDVQDDLDVIANGMSEAGNLTELSDFFDSDEYMEADANVQAYFEEECGG